MVRVILGFKLKSTLFPGIDRHILIPSSQGGPSFPRSKTAHSSPSRRSCSSSVASLPPMAPSPSPFLFLESPPAPRPPPPPSAAWTSSWWRIRRDKKKRKRRRGKKKRRQREKKKRRSPTLLDDFSLLKHQECGDSRHRYKSLHWTSRLRQVHDEPDFYALLLCDYSIDWLIFLVQLLRFGHIQFFRFRFRGSYSEILHFLNSIASSVRNCSHAASPIKIGENRLLVS